MGGNILPSTTNSVNIGSATYLFANGYFTNLYGLIMTNGQPNITSLGTLTGLVMGGNLLVNANNMYTIGSNGTAFSAGYFVNIYGLLMTAAQTNITSLGNLTSLAMAGNIYPITTTTYNIGSATYVFLNGYFSNIYGLLMTAAQTNITSLGTLTGLTMGGNLVPSTTNSYTIGSVSLYFSISYITTGNFNSVVAVSITGTLQTAAQPNITSLGTLTGLTIGGNLLVSIDNTYNIGASGTSFANGYFINLYGTIRTAAQTYITSLGTLTGLTMGGNLLSNVDNTYNIGASGTSFANGYFYNLYGLLMTAAQTNITSLGTLTSLTVSGNILPNINNSYSVGGVSFYFYSCYFTNGNFNSVVSVNLSGTLQTAAQPNITSLGVLNALTIGGNVVVSANNTYSIGTSSNKFTNGYFYNLYGTIMTAAQPNITSLGTLNSQLVINNSTGVTPPTGTGIFLQKDFNGTMSIELRGGSSPYIDFTNTTDVGTSSDFSVRLISYSTNNLTLSGPSSSTFNVGTINSTYLVGTINTAAQTNITSLGILTGLTMGGNLLVSTNNTYNIGASGSAFSNLYCTTINSTTLNGTTLNATNIYGTIITAAQTNITSLGTLTSLAYQPTANNNATFYMTATGTATFCQIQVATPSHAVAFYLANNRDGSCYNDFWIDGVRYYSVGNSQFNITQYLNHTGTTLSLLSISLSSANITNLSTMDQNVSSTSSPTFVNITGTLNTAAQPNITSLGTLSNLIVGGSFKLTGIANTSQTYVLNYDSVSGSVTYATPSGSTYTGTAPINVTGTVISLPSSGYLFDFITNYATSGSSSFASQNSYMSTNFNCVIGYNNCKNTLSASSVNNTIYGCRNFLNMGGYISTNTIIGYGNITLSTSFSGSVLINTIIGNSNLNSSSMTGNVTYNIIIGNSNLQAITSGQVNTNLIIGSSIFNSSQGQLNNHLIIGLSTCTNGNMANNNNPATVVGNGSCKFLTSGRVTSFGYSNCYSLTSGSGIVVFGFNACFTSSTQNDLNVFGDYACSATSSTKFSSSSIISIGNYSFSGQLVTPALGNYNAFTATKCIAIGHNCMSINASTSGTTTISGTQNNFIGNNAGMWTNTTGTTLSYSRNNGIGYAIFPVLSTGSDNCVFGDIAGNDISTGSNNIIIGSSAKAGTGAASGRIVIGYNISGTADNSVRISCPTANQGYFSNALRNDATTTYNIVTYNTATNEIVYSSTTLANLQKYKIINLLNTPAGNPYIGSYSITGVGFKPTRVRFNFIHPSGYSVGISAWGITDGTTSWAGTTDCRSTGSGSYYNTTDCWNFTDESGTLIGQFQFTSFDSDGMTINIPTYYGSNPNYNIAVEFWG